MHQKIKEILEKCNLAYSNGEFYTLTDIDVMCLESILGIYVNADEVTDQIYDVIYATAKEMWPTDSFFGELTSENTGYGIDVIHEIPMGSMEELKEGDFDKWSKGHDQFMISDKLDGCSLVLTYDKGKLVTAATRGHGIKGKDVTRHIKFVENVPQTIKYPDKIIIRGELLFKKSMINSMMDQFEQASGKRPKNGRNTISGLLTRKESYEAILKMCHFVAYWTSTNQGLSFDVLKNLGFEIPFYYVLSKETLTDENMIELVKMRMKFSDYELDGIILTQMDNIEDGFVGGTINPKCSRKFKLGIYDNQAESTVTNINWQISRWGVFTPVLEIEPVEICGCTVSNITAHNYANVLATKCGIGAKIKFKRAGLVIPKLEEVLEESEDYNLPNCKTYVNGVDLVFDEDNPYVDEHLFEYARERDIRALEYFGQKLEIDQLGYGNCAKLYDHFFFGDDIILNPVDIFNIPGEVYTYVIGKNGEKVISCLEAKKSALTEVLFASATGAFGPDIGERVLQQVWDKYGTLYPLTAEQLYALDGFADARVNQYLENQENWNKIHNYALDTLTFKTEKKEKLSDKLQGIVICFTGVRDKEFAEYVNNNGGIATDTWKKDVTHLVVKDKNSTSSKAKKAKDLGIPILTLEEAYEEFKYE